jgi:hypothetical protein
MIAEAEALYQASDYAGALSLLMPFTLGDQAAPDALRIAGLCRLRQGDAQDALALLRRAHALWLRLLRRAGSRPGLPLTEDPDLHLRADGEQIEGRRRASETREFLLPLSPQVLRIVSRAAVPADPIGQSSAAVKMARSALVSFKAIIQASPSLIASVMQRFHNAIRSGVASDSWAARLSASLAGP